MSNNNVCGFISAFALKCWQCSGKDDVNCNDPFDETKFDRATSYVDCSPATLDDQAVCVKALSKVLFDFNVVPFHWI